TLAKADEDAVLQALANQFLGATYWAQGDYLRAIDCLGQTAMSLSGAQRHERFGQAILPSVKSRAFRAPCHAELGRFAEGKVLGEEGLQIAETVAHPSSLMWAYYGAGLLSFYQGDLRRALTRLPPGHGHRPGSEPANLFPQNGCSAGGGIYPGWAPCRRRGVAHAGHGTDHCCGNGRLSGALSPPTGRSASAGRSPGGGARPGRADAGS